MPETLDVCSPNAEKLQQWRMGHPGVTLTTDLMLSILDLNTLRGVNLRGANLRGLGLREADLQGADLSYTNLIGAVLDRANLARTNLEGSDLTRAYFPHADFQLANLRNVIADNATTNNADFRFANLTGFRMLNASQQNMGRWGGLILQAGDSGNGYLIPTPSGWRISLGRWAHKTLTDLHNLIEGKTAWPEAWGESSEPRRLMLRAIQSLCEAHIMHQPVNLIDSLTSLWGKGDHD